MAYDCPVCQDLLYMPAVLPCGHSFCATCSTWAKSVGKECPLCRKPFKRFARNFALYELLCEKYGESYRIESENRQAQMPDDMKVKDFRRSDRYRVWCRQALHLASSGPFTAEDLAKELGDVPPYADSYQVFNDLASRHCRLVIANGSIMTIRQAVDRFLQLQDKDLLIMLLANYEFYSKRIAHSAPIQMLPLDVGKLSGRKAKPVHDLQEPDIELSDFDEDIEDSSMYDDDNATRSGTDNGDDNGSGTDTGTDTGTDSDDTNSE
ncbi:MAG: RING-HC finger protein [Sulfobacillus sp.]